MPSSLHITARDGTDFHVQVAAFAYSGFLESGPGCALMHEARLVRSPDGSVEADLLYRPYKMDSPGIPPEAVAMIDEYDPRAEMVLVVVDSKGAALCTKLTAERIGCTPATAYLKGKTWHVAIEPGTVLHLHEPAGDLEPGFYVFIQEDKARMVLARAGMDDDEGQIVATDETVSVHVDFSELFEKTLINVNHELQ